MISNHLKNYLIDANRYIRRILHQDIVYLRPEKVGNKNVLLSYVTFPFRSKPDDLTFFSHTSTSECIQIAETWLQMGYNVDVIDWDNTSFVPKKEYAVFIDIHANMERLAPVLQKDCKKILHITGAHWRFQNDAEMRRISDLKKRKNIVVKPRRQVVPSRGIEYADCATILGNMFTQDTFAYSNKPLYPIPLSTTIQFPFLEKNFQTVRKNFLWLGSSGMVHKGLDLVLDVFRELPDYHLTICGPVSDEPDFERAYHKELYQSKNITTVGFTDIRSARFREIISSTCALVYPSCSEGQAGSVITCLHAGLIPVISYESGVDVDDFGIILRNCSVEEIRKSVTELSQKSERELQHMSKTAWQYAQDHHTREKFAECYDRFVREISPAAGQE